MSLFRLKIRELVKAKGTTLKEIAAQANVPYSTLATYASSPGMATADLLAVMRIAKVLDISMEELVEVIEE